MSGTNHEFHKSMTTWKDAFFRKAYRFYEQGFVEKAFVWFLKGAKAGDVSCMVWVGVMYGDGVAPDRRSENEIAWYKRAWKKHEICAPHNLAVVYKNQKKYSQAERWFKIAIAHGDGDANLALAKMYLARSRAKEEVHKYLQAVIESDRATASSVEEARKLLAHMM